MAQDLLRQKSQNLTEDSVQQLLLLELIHDCLESSKGHHQMAAKLLSLDTSIHLEPKSENQVALFLQKLCDKAQEVLSEKGDTPGDTVRTAALNLFNPDSDQVPAAIHFGRVYYSSCLDRLSKS